MIPATSVYGAVDSADVGVGPTPEPLLPPHKPGALVCHTKYLRRRTVNAPEKRAASGRHAPADYPAIGALSTSYFRNGVRIGPGPKGPSPPTQKSVGNLLTNARVGKQPDQRCIIDSQSVKTTDTVRHHEVTTRASGYLRTQCRHIVVDTKGCFPGGGSPGIRLRRRHRRAGAWPDWNAWRVQLTTIRK